MSNGFLFVVTRFTSLKVRFKQTESSISRLMALFEPSQTSAARWVQSNSAMASSPRPGATSPNVANASSALAASPRSSLALAL